MRRRAAREDMRLRRLEFDKDARIADLEKKVRALEAELLKAMEPAKHDENCKKLGCPCRRPGKVVR